VTGFHLNSLSVSIPNSHDSRLDFIILKSILFSTPRLHDYTLAGVERFRQFNKTYLDSLATIDPRNLGVENRIDFKIMKSNLESWLFGIDTLKEFRWNPVTYNVGGAIYGLIAREFAPLKDRILSLKERLKAVPAVLEAAKTNLENPPKIHTETAILQNRGNINMVRLELNMFLDQVPHLKGEFTPIQEKAVAALEEYGLWLENDLLPTSTGKFRIGDEKFRRKLYYALESNLSKEQILEKASADLKKTQQAMYETAVPLYKKLHPEVKNRAKPADKKKVIKEVLDKLEKSLKP